MLEVLARNIAMLVIQAVKVQFRLQGHKLTGKLESSLEEKVSLTVTGAKIEILLLPYGIILNNGVPANRIPFGGRTGRGGTSKYIQGLKEFAKKRFFVSDREALGIAFAIAKKQAQQGMPTRSSLKFSKTGKRTDALQEALNDSEQAIEELIQNTLDASIQQILVA